MEPLSDRELDEILGEWRAPTASETLEQRVHRARRATWWQWLLTGSIRVPVPVTLAVAAAFIAILGLALVRGPSKDLARKTEKAGFQPVKRLEVRIIRSRYENGK